MSGIVDIRECPRCKNETLYVDYDCNTGEHTYSCDKCGYGHYFYFEYDNDGKLVTENISYLRNNVVFAARDSITREILWEIPLSKVGHLDEDVIADFINGKHEMCLPKTGCYYNLFDKSNEYEQLFYNGNSFIVPNDPEKIILVKALYDAKQYDGYGIIIIEFHNSTYIYHRFETGITKEDVLKKLEEMLSKVKSEDVKEITATWFNEETNSLEELIP